MSKLWAQAFLGVKTRQGPLTKILDPRLAPAGQILPTILLLWSREAAQHGNQFTLSFACCNIGLIRRPECPFMWCDPNTGAGPVPSFIYSKHIDSTGPPPKTNLVDFGENFVYFPLMHSKTQTKQNHRKQKTSTPTFEAEILSNRCALYVGGYGICITAAFDVASQLQISCSIWFRRRLPEWNGLPAVSLCRKRTTFVPCLQLGGPSIEKEQVPPVNKAKSTHPAWQTIPDCGWSIVEQISLSQHTWSQCFGHMCFISQWKVLLAGETRNEVQQATHQHKHLRSLSALVWTMIPLQGVLCSRRCI